MFAHENGNDRRKDQFFNSGSGNLHGSYLKNKLKKKQNFLEIFTIFCIEIKILL